MSGTSHLPAGPFEPFGPRAGVRDAPRETTAAVVLSSALKTVVVLSSGPRTVVVLRSVYRT